MTHTAIYPWIIKSKEWNKVDEYEVLNYKRDLFYSLIIKYYRFFTCNFEIKVK